MISSEPQLMAGARRHKDQAPRPPKFEYGYRGSPLFRVSRGVPLGPPTTIVPILGLGKNRRNWAGLGWAPVRMPGWSPAGPFRARSISPNSASVGLGSLFFENLTVRFQKTLHRARPVCPSLPRSAPGCLLGFGRRAGVWVWATQARLALLTPGPGQMKRS